MSASPLLDALLGAVPPEMLYHYTSAQGLEGIATSKSLWASAPQYLNDAKEFQHALDLARAHLYRAARAKDGEPVETLIRYLRDQLERLEHFSVCVASLSEEGDLLSQWRGYCPPGGGYSVGFNTQELKQVLSAQGCALARCVYDPAEQTALIAEALDPLLEQLPSEVPQEEEGLKKLGETWVSPVFRRLSRLAPLIKHQSFAEEREWRVIANPHGMLGGFRYRAGRGMFIPYVPVSLLLADNSTVKVRIIVGPMPYQRLSTRSMTGFLRQAGVRWFSIQMSRVPYRVW